MKHMPLPNMAASPEFEPEWDVYRDPDGIPVTITWEQVRAIWHAIRVTDLVRRSEGERPLMIEPDPAVELAKSRLLGRMLIEGRPPTRTKPPAELGAPAWNLLEGGDPFQYRDRCACLCDMNHPRVMACRNQYEARVWRTGGISYMSCDYCIKSVSDHLARTNALTVMGGGGSAGSGNASGGDGGGGGFHRPGHAASYGGEGTSGGITG